MSKIDPRKLETFRVVVQTGKISQAARLLHLSQPAVTAQVRALEEECGRALLTRTSRGVSPNGWGLRLLEAANQVHDVLGEVEGALHGEPVAGQEVLLAASMTTSAYVVPQLVSGFRALHGAVPFRMQVANTAKVVDWVATARVPLGLVEGKVAAGSVRLERYLEDEVVAVAAAGFAGLRGISCAADLQRVPALVREPGSGTRAVVEQALIKVLGGTGLPRAGLQLGSNQSVKMAALAGLGVAFLSRWSVRDEVAAGTLKILPLRDLKVVRTFSWATLSRQLDGPAGRFLAWARANPPPRP